MSPQHEQAIAEKAIRESFKYGLKMEVPITDDDVAKISSVVYASVNKGLEKSEGYNALDASYLITYQTDSIKKAAMFAFNNRSTPKNVEQQLSAGVSDKVKQELLLHHTPSSEISYKEGSLARRLLEQAAFILGAHNPKLNLEQKTDLTMLQSDLKKFLDQFPDKLSSSIRMTLNRQEATEVMVKAAQTGQWYTDTLSKKGETPDKGIVKGLLKRIGFMQKGIDSAESLNRLNEKGLGVGKFATADRSSHIDIGTAAIKYAQGVGV